MTRPPRILAISFNIYGTGLTRVMRTVLGRLSDDFDIDYLGIGYTEPASVVDGVTMHPTNPRGGDVFAAFQALEMAAEEPPDVVFILHDIWMFEYYARVLAPLRERSKLVAYIPLDGDIIDPSIVAPLRGLDHVVVYTEWAADQIRGAMRRLVEAGEPDDFPPVDVIYHGVETATFDARPELVAADYDTRGRAAIKREVFPSLEAPEDTFIVLNAARPAIRKRVDLTIDGFAAFAEGKPLGVKLCLHHAVVEAETDDLLATIDTQGIRDRVIYNPLSPDGGPISEHDLARLYAACDVGINTAMGEGWGLVSFEHASTGAAQVVPRHTACGALWDDTTAQMIEPVAWQIPPFSPLEMGAVDVAGVAGALERLYTDRARLARVSEAGRRYATRPEFGWDAIADEWRTLFGRHVAAVS